jgi:hypothetical protein
MSFPRKILVSRGYGAGWSSWCSKKEVSQFMAEYQPIIEFLETNGGRVKNLDKNKYNELNKLVEECEEIIQKKFNEEIYTGGLSGLCVEEVSGPYKITEYDGAEEITEQYDYDCWFY